MYLLSWLFWSRIVIQYSVIINCYGGHGISRLSGFQPICDIYNTFFICVVAELTLLHIRMPMMLPVGRLKALLFNYARCQSQDFLLYSRSDVYDLQLQGQWRGSSRWMRSESDSSSHTLCFLPFHLVFFVCIYNIQVLYLYSVSLHTPNDFTLLLAETVLAQDGSRVTKQCTVCVGGITPTLGYELNFISLSCIPCCIGNIYHIVIKKISTYGNGKKISFTAWLAHNHSMRAQVYIVIPQPPFYRLRSFGHSETPNGIMVSSKGVSVVGK